MSKIKIQSDINNSYRAFYFINGFITLKANAIAGYDKY